MNQRLRGSIGVTIPRARSTALIRIKAGDPGAGTLAAGDPEIVARAARGAQRHSSIAATPGKSTSVKPKRVKSRTRIG